MPNKRVITHTFYTCILSIFCVFANAQQLNETAFDQLLGVSDDIPVIIMLKSDAAQSSRESNRRSGARNGGWMNLNDYIDYVQNEVSDEMGWVNFNEIVKYENVPAMAKTITKEEFQRLSSSNLVQAIYEDSFYERILSKNIESIGLPNIPSAPNGQNSGEGVSVAVIDSGVEYDHPYFENRVVDGACFSKLKSCHNNQMKDFSPKAGRPCSGVSGCYHGSHVAGIVAGRSTSNSGVAPKANILALNAYSIQGNRQGFTVSDQMSALDWVLKNKTKHNIVAVNMSLGGGFSQTTCNDNPLKRFVDTLLQRGVITVISSGNESKTNGVSKPGCIETAVTVGSLEPDGNISRFSNSYAALDIVAPGGKIYSADLNGEYKVASGTSMSAPHVAGAVALLASRFPQASAAQIIESLQQGPLFRDPRNGLSHPRLFLPNSIKWLKDKLGASVDTPKPSKPEPPKQKKANCEAKRIDGILIENTSAECKNESEEIQW